MIDKRAFTTISLIVMIFFSFIILIIMGVMVFGFDLVDDQLESINFEIGNTSFNETYQQTLGQGIDSMKSQVPKIISLGTLFGMIIILLLIGYFMVDLDPLWMILDIAIIIIAEVIAVTVSLSFRDFMNSSTEFLNIYSTTLEEAATFLLSITVIIPVVGVLIMTMTYIFNKRNAQRGKDSRF